MPRLTQPYKDGNTDEDGNYVVGRGRPPKGGQFRPGVSGNRSGRRKKALNFATAMTNELKTPVRVVENGRPIKRLPTEVIAHQTIRKAMAGDYKSILICQTYLPQDDGSASIYKESDEWKEMIETMEAFGRLKRLFQMNLYDDIRALMARLEQLGNPAAASPPPQLLLSVPEILKDKQPIQSEPSRPVWDLLPWMQRD